MLNANSDGRGGRVIRWQYRLELHIENFSRDRVVRYSDLQTSVVSFISMPPGMKGAHLLLNYSWRYIRHQSAFPQPKSISENGVLRRSTRPGSRMRSFLRLGAIDLSNDRSRTCFHLVKYNSDVKRDDTTLNTISPPKNHSDRIKDV